MPRLPRSAGSLIALALLFVIWELVVRVGNVPAYLLPPPSTVFLRIFSDRDFILYNAGVTMIAVTAGFALSIVVSIPLAAVLAQYAWIEHTVYPLLVASQTIPKVALAPLMVVWFGFGLTPKILITFLICFFPIVVDTLVGFRSLSKEVRWLAKSMGVSRWHMFTQFQVPAALPNIFAGIKVASTLAVVGAVVGEFVAADSGLGYQLIVANGLLDVELSIAILVVLSVLGILVFAVVDVCERLALPWHVSQRHNDLAAGGR
ncbi:ABC transporter permease [Acuticoccus mangrovi]|uniref:ABC transporter permease n=1 Tax=Acuticoccus mangrovi TaxID=2796142 RepID=A0A934IRH4_9HYPH|nr:ABC transporter permease [Acuticoccus mangrovi]MBJ3776917.1 ABC transporter permease [Acuticoccus mangrovi]